MHVNDSPATAKQTDITFQAMVNAIYTYMQERDWDTQPPRSLAISIALEANELLEHYQWSDSAVGSKEELASELADILIYAFHFAAQERIDIPGAMQQKLAKQAEKYPADRFKGKNKDERDATWLEAKLAHKKESL